MQNLLRQIPKIDNLIALPPLQELAEQHGRPYAVQTARLIAEQAKLAIRESTDSQIDVGQIIERLVEKVCTEARLLPLQRVINGTGVILHTNLGRAPLSRELLDEVAEIVSGYCCLEIDLASGKRGVRGNFVRQALARLCAAEDALVVNNNAAAILLTLSEFAVGREVIVSRGELIQIGGGFRIPDVLTRSGANLVEVGSTNITTLEDYRRAIGENTAAIIKVHLSNFSMSGFAERPTIAELSSLKSEDILLIEDLGSGNLLANSGNFVSPDPTPARALETGADLVCFSGDKLLGGPQAGIIAGRSDLISRLAKNPLFRAFRPDKFVYAALQVVLKKYDSGHSTDLAPWGFLQQGRELITERIEKFRQTHKFNADDYPILNTEGQFGAGSVPDVEIESAALIVAEKNAEKAAVLFRTARHPVLGIVRDGKFIIDFITVRPDDEDNLALTIKEYKDSVG
jgi:L-seryl-tRNA(Ser) seleniumtransferase